MAGLARVAHRGRRHGARIHAPRVCHAGATFVGASRAALVVADVDVTGGIADGEAVFADSELREGTGAEGVAVVLTAGELEVEASSATVAASGVEVAELAKAGAVVAGVVVGHVVRWFCSRKSAIDGEREEKVES